jgi:hypothetical protein
MLKFARRRCASCSSAAAAPCAQAPSLCLIPTKIRLRHRSPRLVRPHRCSLAPLNLELPAYFDKDDQDD